MKYQKRLALSRMNGVIHVSVMLTAFKNKILHATKGVLNFLIPQVRSGLAILPMSIRKKGYTVHWYSKNQR